MKKVYVDHGFESDGSASPGTTTVDGNTWTGSGTRADSAGKVYKMRFVATVSADARTVANKAEYSGDDGKTWVKWWELTMKKSK